MNNKKNTKNIDNLLDQTLSKIQEDNLDQNTVNMAAQRVWAKLGENTMESPITEVSQIRTCADFQTLIPAYLANQLPAARTTLFEDHTRECLPCRKALKEARSGKPATASPSLTARRPTSTFTRWLIAVAAILILTLISAPIIQRLTHTGSVQASVTALDGAVYRVANNNSDLLTVGAELKQQEKIRTAKDADAVIYLSDGSQIEMKERSEFYLSESPKGITLHLERGNIIVQTAKQNSRPFYVATNDCLVSVTETTFAVNNGIKGSRISVIEGSAQVDYSGQDKKLAAGEQLTTNSSLGNVPIKDEVSWSRDSAKYNKLLAGLSALRKDIDKVSIVGVRYSTELLDIVPEETVFYVSLPNFSSSLAKSYGVLQEHLAKNAALQEWWQSKHSDDSHDKLISTLVEFGQYLGEEIVVSAAMQKDGSPDSPLILTTTKDPAGLRDFLVKQKEEFQSKGLFLNIVDNPLTVDPQLGNNKRDVFAWINNNLFVVSHSLNQLSQFATDLNAGQKPFASSFFHNRIAQVYQEGAGLILAVDLEKIVPNTLKPGDEKQREVYKELGFLDLKHFIAEQKINADKTQNRAVLSFNQARTGIAGWIADPGPIGGLEFVSPDANVVSAFVIKDPASLVAHLIENLSKLDNNFAQQLQTVENLHQLSVTKDFAATLGGEFVFAVDGPVVPTPAWKAIFEVYDSAKLQNSLERLVTEVNSWATKLGKKGLQIEKSELNGQTFYTIKSLDTGLEMSYGFNNGYFIAAASRALVDQALRYRDSGYTLTKSPKFLSLLPTDTNANFSAMFYYDLAPVLAPVAGQLSKSVGDKDSNEQQMINSIINAKPTLAYAYAQGDRISFATNGDSNPFNLSPANLLGIPNAFNLQKMVKKSVKNK